MSSNQFPYSRYTIINTTSLIIIHGLNIEIPEINDYLFSHGFLFLNFLQIVHLENLPHDLSYDLLILMVLLTSQGNFH